MSLPWAVNYSIQRLVSHIAVEHAAKSVDVSPNGQLCAVGLGNGEFLLLEVSEGGLKEAGRRRDRSQPVQCVRWVVGGGGRRGRVDRSTFGAPPPRSCCETVKCLGRTPEVYHIL